MGGATRTAEALACYRRARALLPSRYAYALQPATEAMEASLLGAGASADGALTAAVGEVAGMGFVSDWFRFLNLRWLQSTTTLRQMRHALQQGLGLGLTLTLTLTPTLTLILTLALALTLAPTLTRHALQQQRILVVHRAFNEQVPP